MPNLDSGHIFLTTFAPIRRGSPATNPSPNPDVRNNAAQYGQASDQQPSYEQSVRIRLAKMPTAQQSPATVHTLVQAPFARNRQTHLARMFVLDDVTYQGRNPSNPIVNKDTMTPQPVDRLDNAYLVFCADIDAVMDASTDRLPESLADCSPEQQADILRAYAKTLWRTMGPELLALYENCVGFEVLENQDDDDVIEAQAKIFAEYLVDCQIETTMPFHDYYLPSETAKIPSYPVMTWIKFVAVTGIIAIIAGLMWVARFDQVPLLNWGTLETFFVAGGITGLLACLVLWRIHRLGNNPMPTGKYDSLPSVLKALYLQQNFTDFFIQNQTSSDEELYHNFQEFVQTHQPTNVDILTQKPGVISSKVPGNVIGRNQAGTKS